MDWRHTLKCELHWNGDCVKNAFTKILLFTAQKKFFKFKFKNFLSKECHRPTEEIEKYNFWA